MGRTSSIFVGVLLLLGGVSQGCPVVVMVPNGGSLTFSAHQRGDGDVTAVIKDNGPGDRDKNLGTIRFIPVNEDLLQNVKIVVDGKLIAGTTATSIYDFGSHMLDDFGLINLPVFVAPSGGVDLLAITDVPTLIAQGATFNPGQTFTVTNGQTPLSSAITFRDASSLSPSSDPVGALAALEDPAVVASLPLFNGLVSVENPTCVCCPEPSTFAPAGIAAMVGLVGVWRRQRRGRAIAA